MLINISDVSQRFGATSVLQQVSFCVQRGDRIGLVGANGSGKSTLLKLITGMLTPDQGSIFVEPACSVGYLPQYLAAKASDTITTVLEQAFVEHTHLRQLLDDLHLQMATPLDAAALSALLEVYGTHAERFELLGGYDFDLRVEQVFAGLQLDTIDRSRSALSLSGGEQTRLMLALLLLQAPDVLLLDEPTNHLDTRTLAWLEEYLQGHVETMLVVSHDRHFLDRTVISIAELDEYSHQVKLYSGNYTAYAQQKALERARWQADYAQQQKEIKALQQEIKAQRQDKKAPAPRDGDKLAYKAAGQQSQATTARLIRSAAERLKRLEAEAVAEPPKELVFKPEFTPDATGRSLVLQVDDLSHCFETDQPLFEHVTLALHARDRILIVGPNGAGKSTLLRLLAGTLTPHYGTIRWSPSAKLGYFQQLSFFKDDSRSVFEAYRGERLGFEREILSELVSWRLFTFEETQRRLGDLSLGQVQKLQLARLLATHANVLLLDEPTNHLAFDVLEQFEAALHAFPGSIIAVSHDRWFIDRFPGQVWLLEDGMLYHTWRTDIREHTS